MRRITPWLLGTFLLACGGKAPPPTAPLPPDEVAVPTTPPRELRETWAGSIAVPGELVHVVVSFVKRDDAWTATLAIPGTEITELALTDVALEADAIRFTLHKPAAPQANEIYQFRRDGDQAEGLMAMAGQRFFARLVKVGEGEPPRPAIARPQTPQPPYPYTEREVTIEAPADGVLAGTLAIPSGTGPFPAVLLISGSGQQDRDSTIFGHKPFRVIADKLAREGFVVLRTDDRAAGQTKGELGSLETDIGDARAAFEWLTKQAEVDAKRVGLIGHSVGGYIAPAVAARTQKVAFIVALAGLGVPGAELIPLQLEALMIAAKLPEPAIARIVAAQRKVGAAIVKGDPKAIRAALEQSLVEAAAATGQPRPDDATLAALVEQKLAETSNPWVVSLFKADPGPVWRKVKAPVLALIGDKDLQVPAAINLAKTAAALRAGGNRDVTTRTLAGLNHLFQRAETGMIEEYAVIEQTFDPEALDEIAAWLRDRTKRR
jgi:uncharacterized protein